jgi:GNAT superfamily N-acetyltransferase
MEIHYRLMNAGSDSEIVQWLNLYQLCYQHPVSRELWHWVHIQNPFYITTKPLVFIAEINNRVIGSVSLIPSPIHYHDGQTDVPLNSCLLCKAMVDPAFRNRGIFRKLVQTAIETSKSEGYDILLTVSNNLYSYLGFIRVGFGDITSMRWSKSYLFIDKVFQKNVQNRKIPAILGKIMVSPLSYIYNVLLPHKKHDLHIRYGDSREFVEEIENFHTSTRSNHGIYGARMPAFIQWRCSRPDSQFKCLTLWNEKSMLGYVIIDFLDGERNALIADLCVRDDDTLLIEILVSEGIAYCKKDNVQFLLTYLLEGEGNVSRFFSFRKGFLKRSSHKRNFPQSRFLFYLLNDKMIPAPLYDRDAWFIQSFDTCLFW